MDSVLTPLPVENVLYLVRELLRLSGGIGLMVGLEQTLPRTPPPPYRKRSPAGAFHGRRVVHS